MSVELRTSEIPTSDEQSVWDFDAIFSNWQFLAAVAWQGYLSDGPGVVVVSVADECADVGYMSGALPTGYGVLVEQYDPRKQIVVVVRHDGSERTYVLNGFPTPRDCFVAGAAPMTDLSVYCVPVGRWPH
ncbi:MAG TPA: hypothetical protein VMW17_24900 [Candidatus Binatia bacterium]|nr:hypothetical protein [Candidatus Binatia bacterium]